MKYISYLDKVNSIGDMITDRTVSDEDMFIILNIQELNLSDRQSMSNEDFKYYNFICWNATIYNIVTRKIHIPWYLKG